MSLNRAGRPKGSKDKAPRRVSMSALAAREAAAAADFDPLAFLIEVAKSDPDMDRRLDAAKACMPYLHPRLNATDLRTSGSQRFIVEWVDATQQQGAPPPGGLDSAGQADSACQTREDGPGCPTK